MELAEHVRLVYAMTAAAVDEKPVDALHKLMYGSEPVVIPANAGKLTGHHCHSAPAIHVSTPATVPADVPASGTVPC